MKVAVALSLVLFASPALAQDGTLRMAWDACPGSPGAVGGVVFNCDPQSGGTYSVLSVFTLRDTLRDVLRMDGTVELTLRDSPIVVPFWHFEAGSCNASGLQLRDAQPSTGCTGVRSTLCSAGGAACDGRMVGYVVGPGGGLLPNHTRLYFTLERPPGTSTALAGSGAGYFAFELRFLMSNADDSVCSGCTQVVAITWLDATLFDTAGTPVAQLASTNPGSDATVYANCAGCTIVRDQRETWGLLKALYR